MFHRLRGLHRWVGLAAAVFLLVISVTGFLLATKGRFGWIRPPESEGAKFENFSELVSLDQAASAAFALGLPVLKSKDDIDRIDYRPGSNIFKIVSNDGYKEVQVDGKTGKVLSVANRTDQLSEDIHDLSFFADALHEYVLPVVATLLFLLALSGIFIFFIPVVRRWRYRHRKPGA